jgi:hypothetical protein
MKGRDVRCPRSQGLAGRWKGVMIKIVAAVALASVVAFSAWAQSYDPSVGSGNLNTTRHDDMSPPSIRRVGKLLCDLDMDCHREELVGPTIPRPRKKR